MTQATRSPVYPSRDYVARSALEQIVETRVQVIDGKDTDGYAALYQQPVTFSNRGSRPGIHVNGSYVSLSSARSAAGRA